MTLFFTCGKHRSGSNAYVKVFADDSDSAVRLINKSDHEWLYMYTSYDDMIDDLESFDFKLIDVI